MAALRSCSQLGTNSRVYAFDLISGNRQYIHVFMYVMIQYIRQGTSSVYVFDLIPLWFPAICISKKGYVRHEVNFLKGNNYIQWVPAIGIRYNSINYCFNNQLAAINRGISRILTCFTKKRVLYYLSIAYHQDEISK